MVQSPFYLLAGQVSSPFFPGVSGTQTEAWGGGGTRESPAYWIPGTSTPKRRLVLGALIRARLGLFGTLGAFTHAPSSSPKPTGDDQLSPHRLRSLPSRAHRRPSLPTRAERPREPFIPHARALLRRARPAGGQRAAAPEPGRPRSPQPGASERPGASYLPRRAARPAPPPARPPAGATAAAPALPAGDPAPGPAPPGAGDPGERPSSPLDPGGLGNRPGGARVGHWSGGASRWCPRASPGPGSFLGIPGLVPRGRPGQQAIYARSDFSKGQKGEGTFEIPHGGWLVGVFKLSETSFI